MKDEMPEPKYQLVFVYAQDGLSSEQKEIAVHLAHDVSKTENLLPRNASETGTSHSSNAGVYAELTYE